MAHKKNALGAAGADLPRKGVSSSIQRDCVLAHLQLEKALFAEFDHVFPGCKRGDGVFAAFSINGERAFLSSGVWLRHGF